MNKLIIIALITLSASATLRSLDTVGAESMMFKATSLKEFEFIQNEADQTWANAFYIGPDAIATNGCASYAGFNVEFPVTMDANSTFDAMNSEIEVCMTVPMTTQINNPATKTFLVTDRFNKNQNWGNAGAALVPAVTVEDLFNETQRTTGYNWFTGMWTAGETNTTTNLTQWCVKTPEWNKFLSNATADNATTYTFYVNVMMNDLATDRTSCSNETNTTSSVQFCSITKDVEGCAMNTYPPTISFTAGGSNASGGTNWLLWGGVAAGVIVVVVVGVVFMKGRGGDDDYATTA